MCSLSRSTDIKDNQHRPAFHFWENTNATSHMYSRHDGSSSILSYWTLKFYPKKKTVALTERLENITFVIRSLSWSTDIKHNWGRPPLHFWENTNATSQINSREDGSSNRFSHFAHYNSSKKISSFSLW